MWIPSVLTGNSGRRVVVQLSNRCSDMLDLFPAAADVNDQEYRTKSSEED